MRFPPLLRATSTGAMDFDVYKVLKLNRDEVTVTALDLPAGLVMNDKGIVSGNIASQSVVNGQGLKARFEVKAKDGTSPVKQRSVWLTRASPAAADARTLNFTHGQPVSFDLVNWMNTNVRVGRATADNLTASGLPEGMLLEDGRLVGTPKDGQLSNTTLVLTHCGHPPTKVTLKLHFDPAKTPIGTKDKVGPQTIEVGKSFSLDMATSFDIPSDSKPTFAIEGAAWMKIDAQGNVTGTPTDSNVGDATITVKATLDGKTVSQTFALHVNAKADDKSNDKIPDTSVSEEEFFFVDAASHFSVPEGKTAAYKVAGADWATVDESGQVTGTPPAGSHGDFPITVTATIDGVDQSRTFKLTVIDPHTQNPKDVELDEGDTFTTETAKFIAVPDGKTATYTVTGAAWVEVDNQGSVSGTPPLGSHGEFKITLTATIDGVPQVKTFAVKVADPSVKDIPDQNASEEEEFSVGVAKFFAVPLGKTATFSIKGADWAKVDATGMVSGTPPAGSAGDHTITVTAVVDGKEQSKSVKVTVTAAGFDVVGTIEDQVAHPSETFTLNASFYFYVPTSKTVTYKVEGAPWLKIDDAGLVTGTPPADAKGSVQVTVTATLDGKALTQAFSIDITA
jgi:Putative Ig domain